MKIKSFRIKNYRSIKDSEICYLSGDGITILAGKNESGKTAILEALEDFGIDRQIREEAINIHNVSQKPEITITFELDTPESSSLIKLLGTTKKKSKPIDIEIAKSYPNNYSISEGTRKNLGLTGLDENSYLKKRYNDLNSLYSDLKEYQSLIPPNVAQFPEIDDLSFDDDLQLFLAQVIPNLPNHLKPDQISDFQEISNRLKDMLKSNTSAKIDSDLMPEELKNKIPNFILFKTFEDIFPSSIPIAEAKDNDLIKDLDLISDLNLELIASGSDIHKQTHKRNLNFRVSEDYKKFWRQDFAHLTVDWDSERLLFFIVDGEKDYPPNLRSKGKQWHLAFYVKVSARSKEEINNIILIDEPGLFLHAAAQKDILAKLEDSARETPIIFSTHSPYLIEPNKLPRVRLVSYKEKEGTTISNKIHKDADKETLTPIITAIGLDLSVGLDIAKENNLLVEGITDYFYLLGMKKCINFKFTNNTHIIPCAGADKFNYIVPLMIGWELNYCVVLDNDNKGKRVNNELLKNFEHNEIKIQFVSEEKDEEIEDLFTKDDFIKCILNSNPAKFSDEIKNSKLLKKNKKIYDKVLLAKRFYENIKNNDLSLSGETEKNFKGLFKNINLKLFNNN